jgi:hypothetical protein
VVKRRDICSGPVGFAAALLILESVEVELAAGVV